MEKEIILKTKYEDVKIFTNNVEETAMGQIIEIANSPLGKNAHIRIMPDTHAGSGCVIGYTAKVTDKVAPSQIGVDIGCGMLAVNLGQVDLDLKILDEIIHAYIPSGLNVRNKKADSNIDLKQLYCYNSLRRVDWLEKSLGTLGGGNHFIEVDVDNENNKYLIIHTGSRNLGKQVADIYQKIAITNMKGFGTKYQQAQNDLIKKLKEENKTSLINEELQKFKETYNSSDVKLPNELCYLEYENKDSYLHDMKICQEFATQNRREIVTEILTKYFGNKILFNNNQIKSGKSSFEFFESIHNYISFEDNIIRKGSISAKKNELLIIPINMKDGCIIGLGKGNDDWNQSAPHGAGRIMSRSEAKKTINLEEYKDLMKDIYSTSVNYSTIDEAPQAYKALSEIVENIKESVDILKIIKPIYNFKASE